jgi:hypothetical protein
MRVRDVQGLQGGQSVQKADKQRFYRVGALGLRWLQDRGFGTKRFDDDANARWRAFRGELTDADRLDLLLRDGAALFPKAFAAREVFELDGLAEDEPFGPEWVSPTPSEAGALLREAILSPAIEVSIEDMLQNAAQI